MNRRSPETSEMSTSGSRWSGQSRSSMRSTSDFTQRWKSSRPACWRWPEALIHSCPSCGAQGFISPDAETCDAYSLILRTIRLRGLLLFFPVCFVALQLQAGEACFTIHGRAHLYGGDGQLRVWRIGTHHDYTPDESSWARVVSWLEAGVKEPDKTRYASPASMLNLFADFLICPTEPFKEGSVQQAKIVRAQHRRYVPVH